MPVSPALSKRAKLRLPEWLWGGDHTRFADEAALRLYSVNRKNGEWEVETRERYEKRPASLVSARCLARPGDLKTGRSNFSALAGLPGNSQITSVSPLQIETEMKRIIASRPGDFTAICASASLLVATASLSSLEAGAKSVYEYILAMAQDDGRALFPNAEAHLIVTNKALGLRYSFTRVLLACYDNPSLFKDRPRLVQENLGRNFASARGLFQDTILGLGSYIDPLFLALSPWAWAFTGARVGGVVVYTLGTAVVGRRGEPAELLQLFQPRGSDRSSLKPTINHGNISAAISWWTRRVDVMFAAITDPSLYCDRGGEYKPDRHFEVLLSIEQAFRHVQSILAADRDGNSRRVMLFNALDTLASVYGSTLDTMLNLKEAERALCEIEAGIDPKAAAILLPNARLAVDALRSLQAGFFLESRVSANGVRAGGRLISRDDAAAQYLRILRNATHGFGGRDDKNRRRDDELLMAHDGTISNDLPLLAYLYLLRLLVNLEGLALRIAARARRIR